MNDKILSQEELDALLSEGAEDVDSNKDSLIIDDYKVDIGDRLSELEIDALGEIGNISMGTAATALSSILEKKVSITTPKVTIITPEHLIDEYDTPVIAVDVSYKEGFEASNIMILKTDDAKTITDLMMGKESVDLDRDISEMDLSAVSEVMNQMMGSAATSMSEIFNIKVDIEPPGVREITIEEGLESLDILKDKDSIIKISFDMEIDGYLDSDIMQLIPISFGKEMVNKLIKESTETNSNDYNDINLKEKEINKSENVTFQNDKSQEVLENEKSINDKVVIKKPVLQNFENMNKKTNNSKIDLLRDIPIEITVELGRTSKTIDEILKFGVGTVVELDNLVGEPLNIYANNKLIGKGEVVVIDDNFGVRITEVDSNNDKLV